MLVSHCLDPDPKPQILPLLLAQTEPTTTFTTQPTPALSSTPENPIPHRDPIIPSPHAHLLKTEHLSTLVNVEKEEMGLGNMQRDKMEKRVYKKSHDEKSLIIIDRGRGIGLDGRYILSSQVGSWGSRSL